MPVNPNEASAGFMAVDDNQRGCEGCAFDHSNGECFRARCSAVRRRDGCYVIFVPLTNKPATANFPHDDMGTPV